MGDPDGGRRRKMRYIKYLEDAETELVSGVRGQQFTVH